MSETTTPELQIELDVNQFLASGANRLDASFVVTPQGFGELSAVSVPRFVAIVGDRSGSMGGGKIAAAKQAACKVIDMLSSEEYFAVIFFSDGATTIYPMQQRTGTMMAVQATAANKAAAKHQIMAIEAHGGTRISRGLHDAYQEFLKVPNAEGTCILLTDGQNNADDGRGLDQTLAEIAEGRKRGRVMKVQSRGVGTDWQVDQLRHIADMTLGDQPVVVADAGKLEEDFARCLQAAQSNTLSNVRVKLWLPQMVKLIECKQIAPAIIDLKNSITKDADGLTHILQTGGWNNEPREFYVAFELVPQAAGKRVCAGRISLAYTFGGQEFAAPDQPLMILAEWTEDKGKSARIPLGVARATGSVELATAIQEGVRAYEAGQHEVATVKLGRAVQLAAQTGNEEMTVRLQGLVDIVDPHQGTVRLKKNVDKVTTMDLDAGSTRRVVRKPSA
jgi:Mg-chelatase subunit ChlD